MFCENDAVHVLPGRVLLVSFFELTQRFLLLLSWEIVERVVVDACHELEVLDGLECLGILELSNRLCKSFLGMFQLLQHCWPPRNRPHKALMSSQVS